MRKEKEACFTSILEGSFLLLVDWRTLKEYTAYPYGMRSWGEWADVPFNQTPSYNLNSIAHRLVLAWKYSLFFFASLSWSIVFLSFSIKQTIVWLRGVRHIPWSILSKCVLGGSADFFRQRSISSKSFDSSRTGEHWPNIGDLFCWGPTTFFNWALYICCSSRPPCWHDSRWRLQTGWVWKKKERRRAGDTGDTNMNIFEGFCSGKMATYGGTMWNNNWSHIFFCYSRFCHCFNNERKLENIRFLRSMYVFRIRVYRFHHPNRDAPHGYICNIQTNQIKEQEMPPDFWEAIRKRSRRTNTCNPQEMERKRDLIRQIRALEKVPVEKYKPLGGLRFARGVYVHLYTLSRL